MLGDPMPNPRLRDLTERGMVAAGERAALEAVSGEVLPAVPEARRSPDIIARLLGERGFWSLTPAAQMKLFEEQGSDVLEVTDIRGTLEIYPSTIGLSGMREALVFTALASLWGSGSREGRSVETSMRGLAEQAGISWSGKTGARLLEALKILRFTGYSFVVEAVAEGRRPRKRDNYFTLLSELETAWEGEANDPRRRIRVEFDPRVHAWLHDRRNIRPIDGGVFRELGPQRELARRLFLLLEVLPAGEIEGGRELINRIVDRDLAGSLGTDQPLRKLVPALRRAGEAIVQTAARYEAIGVVPREKMNLDPRDPRYLLKVTRVRMAPRRRQKP